MFGETKIRSPAIFTDSQPKTYAGLLPSINQELKVMILGITCT